METKKTPTAGEMIWQVFLCALLIYVVVSSATDRSQYHEAQRMVLAASSALLLGHIFVLYFKTKLYYEN